jgi:nucleotide-binding universal stress UspA family protein
MISTIVVPLDGSDNAEQALPYARALARRTGATIALVSAIDIPAEFGSWSVTVAATAAREMDQWMTDSEAYLRRAATTLSGIPTTISVRVGRAAHEILAVVGEAANPLVVMTSHGRTGVKRLFLGSVANRVVRDARCPVLVIRMRSDAPPVAEPAFDTVLVPLDGSPFGEAALDQAVAVLGQVATLHLLRVVEFPVIPLGGPVEPGLPLNYGLVAEYTDATRDEATQYLQALQTKLAERGQTVTVEVRDGRVVDEILAAAGEQRADIIAMATRGRGGVGRLVFGSVAEGVLHESPLPLLLVRAE